MDPPDGQIKPGKGDYKNAQKWNQHQITVDTNHLIVEQRIGVFRQLRDRNTVLVRFRQKVQSRKQWRA